VSTAQRHLGIGSFGHISGPSTPVSISGTPTCPTTAVGWRQGDEVMAYGHAERTLAAIRLLEAETRELLNGLEHLDPEQRQWLQDAAESAAVRLALPARHGVTATKRQWVTEPAGAARDVLR
jgi:hypothetical protein